VHDDAPHERWVPLQTCLVARSHAVIVLAHDPLNDLGG
jgi:hypothetical protein